MSVYYMPITVQTHDFLSLLHPQPTLGYQSFPYKEEGFRKKGGNYFKISYISYELNIFK